MRKLLERLEKIRSGEETAARDFRSVEQELRRKFVGKRFGPWQMLGVGLNITGTDKMGAPIAAVYTFTMDFDPDQIDSDDNVGRVHLFVKRKTGKEDFEATFKTGTGFTVPRSTRAKFKGWDRVSGYKVRPDRFEQDLMAYVKGTGKRFGKALGL